MYVGYLLAAKESNGRGLKEKSVEKYVSGLRLIQMRKGFFEPWVRHEIIKQILRGAANRGPGTYWKREWKERKVRQQ